MTLVGGWWPQETQPHMRGLGLWATWYQPGLWGGDMGWKFSSTLWPMSQPITPIKWNQPQQNAGHESLGELPWLAALCVLSHSNVLGGWHVLIPQGGDNRDWVWDPPRPPFQGVGDWFWFVSFCCNKTIIVTEFYESFQQIIKSEEVLGTAGFIVSWSDLKGNAS